MILINAVIDNYVKVSTLFCKGSVSAQIVLMGIQKIFQKYKFINCQNLKNLSNRVFV